MPPPAAPRLAPTEAEEDGIDPLGGLSDELNGDSPAAKAAASKLRQGWEYTEYTDELSNPHLQPTRIWGGITHPRLRPRMGTPPQFARGACPQLQPVSSAVSSKFLFITF